MRSNRCTCVEMVIICLTPAASARASSSSRSASKSGKSRWQCVSISMPSRLLRRVVFREDRLGLWQVHATLQAADLTQETELPLHLGDRQQVEQLCGRSRHIGL